MIFEVLQQLLGEFFVDIQEENVSLYTGDLFEPSHFKLSNVFLKTSLINSLQLPFELSAGYIGNVKVEGLLGAVAGWPLEVSISDVCLVLRPNKVPWENELLIRYAKELIIAICQTFGVPSEAKKGDASFISPAKWFANRVQAMGADMIVQLEHVHIRVESERSDNLVAYGLYMPLIRFASREIEEQILYRRQQPGVTYPKTSETLMSKLLTIENVSFYADLDAEAYWTVPTDSEMSTSMPEHPVAAALITSPEADTSPRRFTHEDALQRFKECAMKPFARDKRRELVFIRVIWVKLDFGRGQQHENENGGLAKPVLAAIDIATEEIELHLDFDQIAVILEELEHVFFPALLLNPSKVVPLLNWQIGPVTMRLSEGTSDHVQTTKRGIGIEVGIQSCSGAVLLTRTPFMRILVEMRVGLFHVTLVRQPHFHNGTSDLNSGNVVTEYKWISSDYIRSPEDGFFYIGLKYSAQEVAKPTGRVQFAGNLEEDLGLKGRMCIGPIKIDCNEAAMRTAMGQNVADELRAGTDVSTSTHFSVLQDAYHSFVGLVAHLPKRKGSRNGHASSPRATKRPSASNVAAQVQSTPADQQKLEKSAKRTRMLHALLLRSSTFEVQVGTLELNLSAYTNHIEKALRTQGPKSIEASKSPENREDVSVMLPTTTYRLQNRPSMNECIVDVAGARIVYRSTKQGRAAVIRHLAQLFKL
ncbi:hypothetical protein PRIC2_002099 [Phytophthora ramorum]|uniref:uncharacterized protein n=1 Tax=Phytophthora ramorum TaxID=164328 RepID=UPI00309A6D21|nr:hypothetical protein KRP23_1156 [Phytophthora ramorum]